MLRSTNYKVDGDNPKQAPHPRRCKRCHVMYYFNHVCIKKVEDRQKQKIKERINNNKNNLP